MFKYTVWLGVNEVPVIEMTLDVANKDAAWHIVKDIHMNYMANPHLPFSSEQTRSKLEQIP
jgi:hypothetical protein